MKENKLYFITDEYKDYKQQILHIVPEKLHHFIDANQDTGKKILSGVIDDIPVAVLIALPDSSDKKTYTVIHLYVKKKYRRIGLAGELIKKLSNDVKKEGYCNIGMIGHFSRNSNETVGFKKFCASFFDQPLTIQKTEFYTSSTEFNQEKWFTYHIPEGYQLVLWSEVTGQNKKFIKENIDLFTEEDSKSNDFFIDPFEVSNYEPATSYGIINLKSGNLAGWNITEKNSCNFLVYRKLYVTYNERNNGLLYPLLTRSIDTCMKNFNGACFLVQGINRKMRIGIDIMMGHLCNNIVETYSCVTKIR